MKLLLVEDNTKLSEATKLYLESQGFNVDTTFNGVQAISKVKDLQKENKEYDVIILDRMMPLKDGIETLRDIKNMNIGSGIIILTAKDTVEDKVFGLAAGADDYMVKPFNVKELIARIHSIYRRNLIKKEILNTNIVAGENKPLDISYDGDVIVKNNNLDFNFNINTGEISFDKNKTIILTQKESSIFKILLEKENQVVSKESILKAIWKESDTPSSRFVDVHVHNLRSKLLKEKFLGKIDTIRGAGYKLILNK